MELKPIVQDDYYVISNSEVGTFNTCERQWMYAYGQKLILLSYSTALTRGILGHACLAAFYTAIKEGKSFPEAVNESTRVLMAELINPNADAKMISPLTKLLTTYYMWVKDSLDSIEILEVEKAFILPVADNFAYGLRLDLLVKDLSPGRFYGDTLIWDHKFTYDFWSEDSLRMNAQIPKYIGVLRAEGQVVRGGILNQLRYRFANPGERNASQIFRRDPIMPTNAKVQGIFREQVKASEAIINLRRIDPADLPNIVRRSLNKMNCDRCPFQDLCSQELEGLDTTLTRQTWYRPNTYGYTTEST
jgi:hypothetical protein